MYYDVIEAGALRDYAVYLKFEDGTEGVIKLDSIVGCGEVFKPLRDKTFFRQLRADPQLDTIVWPNGADLAPEVLYDKIKNAPQGEPVSY